ncbi:MAG: LPS export ABC transporter ATP-binding protein [Deltaproteobacteria bacterium]|nr:LPS export ABC transporter ATP-binding protein [Deltaproteobacteria bacterium]MBW2018463.1 LPS export ABC transporter ATP-binding protein [Deltaproteobacteria bacterium]MBW2074120.1 LPS export ABC transporter ATP-binding protein [Deltaproteobacteria bacterium]RLB83620.1 MAG: LPS export ABC transporter ATP-binding protein [Deltaproteobacteria bacterium]
MATLLAKDLVKIYKGKRVVNSVTLEVESGSVVGLLGPNGAGKTTTFYTIIGLIRPDSGKVFLDGEDITSCPMHVRARKGIGYLPQDASVFRKLTVKDNILAILETLPLSNAERHNRLSDLLEELNIRHLAERKAYSLSGGERRRVEITRALVTTPSFILLDEPLAGIDPIAVTDIQNIIGHLKKRGIGVVISDHNVRETLGVCDHAYILNEGMLIESGPPEVIASSSVAREVYLGKCFRL